MEKDSSGEDDLWFRKGNDLLTSGRYQEVAVAFDEAVRITPMKADA
jgi:hypothetical protein